MAGIKFLEISDIRLDEPKVKKNHDDDFNHKQTIFIKRFGQFYIPIVALVNDVYRVIDGIGFIKNYQAAGNETIMCNLISPDSISLRDFITFRLFFNIKRSKLNHIIIAELISSSFKTKHDYKQLGNKINISEDDIEKYAKLLDFDWDEFARKPIGIDKNEQMSFFDMFEEDENDIF